MAKTNFVMHVEAKRGWWSGVSTTLCGLTFTVEKGGYFYGVTCAACKQIKAADKAARKAKGAKR